jgi:hypothetical protein
VKLECKKREGRRERWRERERERGRERKRKREKAKEKERGRGREGERQIPSAGLTNSGEASGIVRAEGSGYGSSSTIVC